MKSKGRMIQPMLKLDFWEDVDKKEDGCHYHCCAQRSKL